jgi:hypothetical protein
MVIKSGHFCRPVIQNPIHFSSSFEPLAKFEIALCNEQNAEKADNTIASRVRLVFFIYFLFQQT